MLPSLEPEHLFSPQQPPRRRWVWIVVVAAIMGVLIYFVASKSLAPNPVSPLAAGFSKSAHVVAVEPQVSKISTARTTPVLPALITSSEDEKRRFAKHEEYLRLEAGMAPLTQLVGDDAVVPPGTSELVLATYADLRARLDSGEGLSDDSLNLGQQLLVSRNMSLWSQRIKDGIAYPSDYAGMAAVLLRVIQDFKGPTSNYYSSFLVEKFRDPSLPLTEKISLADAFRALGDPEVSETILSLLKDVPAWPGATKQDVEQAQFVAAEISSP